MGCWKVRLAWTSARHNGWSTWNRFDLHELGSMARLLRASLVLIGNGLLREIGFVGQC